MMKISSAMMARMPTISHTMLVRSMIFSCSPSAGGAGCLDGAVPCGWQPLLDAVPVSCCSCVVLYEAGIGAEGSSAFGYWLVAYDAALGLTLGLDDAWCLGFGWVVLVGHICASLGAVLLARG